MYPKGHALRVEVPPLAAHLCGRSRPEHFAGVALVVAKLLVLALPHLAVFGEKDRQQLALVRRLALDLHLPTEIVGRPTVREPDGLAMSSRNAYLTPAERALAPELYQGLLLARDLLAQGETRAEALARAVRDHLAARLPGGETDYVEIVDSGNMQPVATAGPGDVIAAAVRLGRARLIDNLILGDERAG
jgi:pantoate--beta-alanine ligase